MMVLCVMVQRNINFLPPPDQRISWQDVIDLSPDYINQLLKMQKELGEEAEIVTFHSPEELQQIANALDVIEQTDIGQQLFRGILAKQLNPDYANGAYNDQPISVIQSIEGMRTVAGHAEFADENMSLSVLMFDIEQINQAVYIGSEGQAFNVPLIDVIIHELAHAADATVYQNNKVKLETDYLEGEYGIRIMPHAISLDTSNEFFQQLPMHMQDMLIDLRATQPSIFDDNTDTEAYEKLLSEYSNVLETHPLLHEIIRLGELEHENFLSTEHYALLAENTFRNEITNRPDLQQLASELRVDVSQHFHRLSYDAVDLDEFYSQFQPGSIFHPALSVEDRLEFIRINQEWQEKFGQYDKDATTIPQIELRESQFVDELERINDILPPELLEFMKANILYDENVIATEINTVNPNINAPQHSDDRNITLG
jgi:hypothetical protein